MKADWKRRLWREPDAGNLHVRFDEGEGCDGHWPLAFQSVRPSLLYRGSRLNFSREKPELEREPMKDLETVECLISRAAVRQLATFCLVARPDLPPGALTSESPASLASSSPVGPNPSQSNRIKPAQASGLAAMSALGSLGAPSQCYPIKPNPSQSNQIKSRGRLPGRFPDS